MGCKEDEVGRESILVMGSVVFGCNRALGTEDGETLNPKPRVFCHNRGNPLSLFLQLFMQIAIRTIAHLSICQKMANTRLAQVTSTATSGLIGVRWWVWSLRKEEQR